MAGDVGEWPDTPHALAAMSAAHWLDGERAAALTRTAIDRAVGGSAFRTRHRLLKGWAALRAGRTDDAVEILEDVTATSGRDAMVAGAVHAALALRGDEPEHARDLPALRSAPTTNASPTRSLLASPRNWPTSRRGWAATRRGFSGRSSSSQPNSGILRPSPCTWRGPGCWSRSPPTTRSPHEPPLTSLPSIRGTDRLARRRRRRVRRRARRRGRRRRRTPRSLPGWWIEGSSSRRRGSSARPASGRPTPPSPGRCSPTCVACAPRRSAAASDRGRSPSCPNVSWPWPAPCSRAHPSRDRRRAVHLRQDRRAPRRPDPPEAGRRLQGRVAGGDPEELARSSGG